MRDQEIIGLWEAYQQVYTQPQEVEQLDENRAAMRNPEEYENTQKSSQSRRQAAMNDPHTGINSPAFHAFMAQMGRKKKKVEDQKESFDLFDYLLEYLVAEGYADTNKAALAIMANMSEEWKDSIMEGHGSRRSFKSQSADERGRINMFKGSDIEYTPHKNFDPKANLGQGQILRPNQAEKQRRKKLAQSAMDDNR